MDRTIGLLEVYGGLWGPRDLFYNGAIPLFVSPRLALAHVGNQSRIGSDCAWILDLLNWIVFIRWIIQNFQAICYLRPSPRLLGESLGHLGIATSFYVLCGMQNKDDSLRWLIEGKRGSTRWPAWYALFVWSKDIAAAFSIEKPDLAIDRYLRSTATSLRIGQVLCILASIARCWRQQLWIDDNLNFFMQWVSTVPRDCGPMPARLLR